MPKVPPVRVVQKGWGKEIWVANSPLYCGKILCIDKGKKFSWHMHCAKEEHFYVVSGSFLYAEASLEDGARFRLKEAKRQGKKLYDETPWEEMGVGDIVHIKPGCLHQVYAETEDVVLAEFSTQHFDEDSIRVIKGD